MPKSNNIGKENNQFLGYSLFVCIYVIINVINDSSWIFINYK